MDTPNVLTRWACSGKIGASDITAEKYAECPLNQALIAEAAVGTLDDRTDNSFYIKSVAEKTLYALDAQFDSFERSIYSGDKSARVVPKLINGIVPLIGLADAASSRVLGATTLVTNTYDTLSTDLLGASAFAVLARMRKDRKATRDEIMKRVSENTFNANTGQSYSFRNLVADLQSYEKLGDVLNALRLLETDDSYSGEVRLN